MEDLINKKKFYKARLKAEDFLAIRADKDGRYDVLNAKFWYLYGVTIRLTNHDDAILAEIRNNLRACPDYSSTMDGDWLRGDAFYAASHNDLDYARELMVIVHKTHQNDQLRLALDTTTDAKIEYQSRHYKKAAELYLLAINTERPLMAESWHINIHLQILKCLVADGCKSWQRQLHAAIVLDNDKNLSHRLRASIINNGGRFGNFIDDILIQIGLV